MSLNRQIVADQYYMYSAAWVNQFEMKDKCFKFVINVSRQGNNVNPIQDWLFRGCLRMGRGRGGQKASPP